MAKFIQIIEYKTSRIDELNAALDAWLDKTTGRRAATRGMSGPSWLHSCSFEIWDTPPSRG